MKLIIFTLGILFSLSSFAQKQNIRGIIIDSDSKIPLFGANVVVLDEDPIIGATTDFDGRFKIEGVSLGRHTIQISYVGYETQIKSNVEVISGKEVIINISLQESIMMDEVVIEVKKEKDKTINKMASVSARTFSIDESMRYAGSLNDVARMAQNFAGVQGANDSRNDIVIRGNSPTGVLYRLEDVDIPNPNHFALNGTTGGPVSILNNNVLDNSDFMTGAFPAEYGNALAGVFDLKLRSGNNQKHEFLSQFGFNGLELMAEGPINKEKYSSYIVDYRYSTLKLFQLIGMNIGTGTAVPDYQDAFFKLSFPNKKGKTDFWGLGGVSNIALLDSEQNPDENLFQEGGEDLIFLSKIGVMGLSNTYRFNSKSYLKTTLSTDATYNQLKRNYLDTVTQIYDPNYRNNSTEGKQSLNIIYNYKHSARHLFKVGSYNSRRFFNLSDSIHREVDSIQIAPTQYHYLPERWVKLTDYKGATYFIQPFVQWQFRANEKLTFNTGLHAQYFAYNNKSSLEPRLGVKWNVNTKNTISFGYGLHNQLPTSRLFFRKVETADGAIIPNKNLGMIRSQHFVLGYDLNIGKHSRFKSEVYYQLLDKVPVDVNNNSYSVLNFGANFDLSFPDTLVNKGTGSNYGLELTLERFLNNGFYYLMTTSLYQSQYKGSDGIERNTVFNGNYTFNALIGKEFFFKPKDGKSTKSSLLIDLKGMLNGGQRYVPINLEASKIAEVTVYDYSRAFENRYPDYMRMDLKIGFKMNSKKLTQEWSINFQNLTNRKNVFTRTYSPSKGEITTKYQVGFLPIGQYKIWF